MFDIKKFGVFLSQLRKKAEMTQNDFANKINLTRQAVSKYENGDSFPDISILIKIAKVFNVTIDELINSGEPADGEKSIIKNILTLTEFLNKSDLLQLINNEELLTKIIPFLDTTSKESIVRKIIEGENDWRLLKIILPYTEEMTSLLECAFVEGALPKEAHNLINEYWINKNNRGIK